MSGKGDSYRKLTPEQRKAFEDNFDAIFGKKKKVADEEWDEKRIDVVGSNGNDGLHYDNDAK